MKNDTFVKTSGFSAQGSRAQDTIPTITYSLSSFFSTTPAPESLFKKINTNYLESHKKWLMNFVRHVKTF